MKTILSRLKTLIQNSSVSTGTLSYVQSVEIVHPTLPETFHSKAKFPKIIFTPESTVETWISTQEKESVNIVNAYILLIYNQREASIMGDTARPGVQGKGIIDILADFLSVVRGHRLSVAGTTYLNKPLDILNVQYMEEQTDDESFFLVASIRMECRFLFLQTSLPGDI